MQALVIGLGHFGTSLARTLTDRGAQVLVVDHDESRVQGIAEQVDEAMCLDATELEALQRTSPGQRDVCICAIGDDSREASIICTALLRQIGAKRVIARANDDLHARILSLIGAHQVVNPERAFGERFASQILHQSVKGEMLLGQDVLLTEVDTPEEFLGKTLGELSLPRRFKVMVVAVRKPSTRSVVLPDADTRLEEGDGLVLVSRSGAVADMLGAV
jgi:trk system potassium uptake protein TrkA